MRVEERGTTVRGPGLGKRREAGTTDADDALTPRGGKRGVVVVSAAAIGVGVVVVGAVGAYRFGVFGAPGAQPSSVVPSNAFAYAAIDFNPSAKEKIGAYELSKKFPGAHVTDADSLKDSLLEDVLSDDDSLDYERDVKPWLGDRVAVAAVPVTGKVPVAPLVVLACTDEDEARTDLTRLQRDADGDFAFAFKDDYVLLGETQHVVDDAVAATSSLEDDSTFARDMDDLGGDQIGRAWANLTPDWLRSVLPRDLVGEVADELPTLRAALGVHVTGNYVEVQGTAVSDAPSGDTAGQPVTLADALPADSDVALEATGLGPAVMSAWPSLAPAARAFGITAQAAAVGLRLPGDLSALLGDDIAFAARVPASDSGIPAVLLTSRSADAGTAQTAAGKLVPLLGSELPGLAVRPTESGYALSNDSAWSSVAGGGGLAATDSFRQAVPHASTAGAWFYVDLGALLRAAGEDHDPNLAPLHAAGISGEADGGTGRFTLRLTTR